MGIDMARTRRVLQGGGMVLVTDAGYQLCRTQDARRGFVGKLNAELVEALIECAEIEALDTLPERFVWCGPRAGARARTRPLQAPVIVEAEKAKRAHGLLARALKQVSEDHARARLAGVAARFQRDVEALSAGQVRAMSWEFVPRGRGAKARGGKPGFSDGALVARETMTRLEARLGKEKLGMLEAIIVREQSARQIEARFEIASPRVLEVAQKLLRELADAYDLNVRAER